MAKKGLRNSPSYKAAYSNYKNNDNWLKNKIRKLEKVVRTQPNNTMAKEALKKIIKGACVYTRSNKGSHPCKGRLTIFGFSENNNTKQIRHSYIWHTSNMYSKWFLPSASK